MRYWDSSAIVPLLMDEPATDVTLAEIERDPQVAAWWGTETECASAITRKEREGTFDEHAVAEAFRRLAAMTTSWQEVLPNASLRRAAIRLLRVHPLHSAGALQLAAATVLADGHPAKLGFVTRDTRLAEAARREGFAVIVPGDGI